MAFEDGVKGYLKPPVVVDSGPINPNLLKKGISTPASGFSGLFSALVDYPVVDTYNNSASCLRVQNNVSGSGGAQAMVTGHYSGWQIPIGDYTFQARVKYDEGKQFRFKMLEDLLYTGTGQYELIVQHATFTSPTILYVTTIQVVPSVLKVCNLKLENGLQATKFVDGVP